MKGRTVRTLEKRAEFLAALSATASVTAACEKVSIARDTAYTWRKAEPDFAAAWDEAVELGTDALEDEAIRRAHHGVDRPVYQSKELVGYVREYSDTLLIFMLKARRPDKFKDRVAHEGLGHEDRLVAAGIFSRLKQEHGPTRH